MKVIPINPELRDDLTIVIAVSGTYQDHISVEIRQDDKPCRQYCLEVPALISEDATSAISSRRERRDSELSRCPYVYPIVDYTDRIRVVAIAASLYGAATIVDDLKKHNPDRSYTICREKPVLSDEFVRLEYEPTELEKGLEEHKAQDFKEQVESQFHQSFKDIMTNIEKEYK